MSTTDIIRLRQDVKTPLRRRIFRAIEAVLEEEVAEVLST